MNISQHPVTLRLLDYFRLMRLDKPIGSLLLLWPTLSGLWIASNGKPDWHLLVIFSAGTILMRSAGDAINDYADQDFDRHVKRTAQRPLTAGRISGWEAVLVSVVLALICFAMIWPLNLLTKQLSIVAVLVAATYPYTKRFFPLPQAYLGIAYGFGVPMAFAAVQNQVPSIAWYLLIANVFWALAYDTEYAMVDRDDDIKIGIKTSALTFGKYDVIAIMCCYAISFLITLVVGWHIGLRTYFIAGLLAASGIALYHYQLIKDRDRMACFAAFRHNNWVGAVIFAGIAMDYALKS